MARQPQNTMVGMFALVGLVVLSMLVFVFGGGKTLFADTYPIDVHFPEGVSGVAEGQTVNLQGKRVGTTKAVRFFNENKLDMGVVVGLAIDGEIDLPDSCELIVSPSIMGIGSPAISLIVKDPSSVKRLPRDGRAMIRGRVVTALEQVLPPEMKATFEEGMKQMSGLAEALTPAAENLARLLEARGVQDVDASKVVANLATVVERLDMVLRSIHQVLGDEGNQANFRESLANIKQMSASGAAVMEDAKKFSSRSEAMAKQLEELMARLMATADQTSATLKEMEGAMAKLNRGEGSAGLMLTDNRLYEELVLTVRRMSKALDEMREVLDLAKQGKLRIRAF